MKSLMEKFNLSAKTAFVTGGCYGIGLDLKKILSEAGATVTISERDEERLKLAAEEISKGTGNVCLNRMVASLIRPPCNVVKHWKR